MKIERRCPLCHGGSMRITTVLSSNLAYPNNKDRYFVECNSCGARGSFAASTEGAIEKWNNQYKESDYENFVNMLRKSEFSNYFTEESNICEFEGETIDTKDVIFLNQTNGTTVNAIFHKGTEDLLGIVLNHKCTCGGNSNEGHSCK